MVNRIFRTITNKCPQQAFEQAVTSGRLTTNPSDDNFAGLYMYMHTDSNGKDIFKNINTRKYDV